MSIKKSSIKIIVRVEIFFLNKCQIELKIIYRIRIKKKKKIMKHSKSGIERRRNVKVGLKLHN